MDDWTRTRAIWHPLPRLALAALLSWIARVVLDVGWWFFDKAKAYSEPHGRG